MVLNMVLYSYKEYVNDEMSTITNVIFKNNLTWKVLTYFLAHPSSVVYVKELAQILRVGPTSANNVLHRLEKVGLLIKQERARSHFYSLNKESTIVKPLKVAYFLARLEEVRLVGRLLEIDEGLISLCIYGSFADGTFDEKSDLDMVIISQKEKRMFNSLISELENLLGLEINIEVFTLSKWKSLKEKDRGFYQEVVASHILQYGSQI